MQVPGANIAASIFGAAEAKSRDAAAKLSPKRHVPRPEDGRPDGDEVVVQTEATEAIRNMKGNEHEEAHEDHQEHAGYSPRPGDAPPRRPTIDLEG